MSHDHVGVPRFIEEGFSNSGRVYCYNLVIDKIYPTNTERLGTKNNYYEDDVEKDILAQDVEHQFSLFYKDFCSTRDPDVMVKILNLNQQLVKEFLSFMCMRSKKVLDEINKNCLSASPRGKVLSHSELLRKNSLLKVDFLKMIENKHSYHPLINCSKTHLINNSVGYGIILLGGKVNSFYMPLNYRVGILVTSDVETQNGDVIWITPSEDKKAMLLNQSICVTEKVLGNGFIFSEEKELLKSNANFIKGVKIL